MEILGVGPMELLFILIIALIVLGPEDMAKAGKTVGRTLRKIVMSPTWHAVQQTSRELRTLPNRLMREAGLEEEIKDLRQTQQELRKQVDDIRRIHNPLQSAADDLKQEARSLRGDFGAWTRTAPDATPPAETGPHSPDEPPPAGE
jgi:sec-independent protein translocase protein TatB